MSLELTINEQITAAMKSKDEVGLRTLRAIKAEILKEKTAAGAKDAMTEADEMKMLMKMAKQRRESLEIFEKQNREDLAATEREELAILDKFLPKQMTEDDVRSGLKEIIAETGASSPADMGKVMGVATKKFAGQADGKMISALVKELLAGN